MKPSLSWITLAGISPPPRDHGRQVGSAAGGAAHLFPRRRRPGSDRLESGGRSHPQWYYNLKANPECRFGGIDFVASEVTDAKEYDRLFGLAEMVYAGYRDYRGTTAGRRIPLFRLTAR